MEWKKEIKILAWIAAIFGLAFFLPVESVRFNTAMDATLDLVKWYAREHVVLCLLPAFFIAGIISVFVSQASVLRYFGANAKKWLSYTVAAVSGAILAVCSCTILPLFSSIHKRGAGLGPAVAFLIVQGLIGSGMGKGPALALLLSGPSLSLPSMLVIRGVIGTQKTLVYVILVIVMSTLAGLLYGAI